MNILMILLEDEYDSNKREIAIPYKGMFGGERPSVMGGYKASVKYNPEKIKRGIKYREGVGPVAKALHAPLMYSPWAATGAGGKSLSAMDKTANAYLGKEGSLSKGREQGAIGASKSMVHGAAAGAITGTLTGAYRHAKKTGVLKHAGDAIRASVAGAAKSSDIGAIVKHPIKSSKFIANAAWGGAKHSGEATSILTKELPNVLKKAGKGGLIGAAGIGAAYLGAHKLAERGYRKKAEQMGVKESSMPHIGLLTLLLEARKARKPKNWIQGMKMKKGALHNDLGIPKSEKIPLSKVQAAANSDDPTIRRRAQLALNFRGMNK